MFGSIGITELLLIAAIALMFLGPEKFPEFAKIMARTIRDIRGYVQDAQKDIAKELKPVKEELENLRKIDPEAYLEKLAGPEEEEEGPPNLEPDPSTMSFDLDSKEEEDEEGDSDSGEGGSIEGTIHYDSYDSAPEEPEETDGDDSEKLDG